VLSSDGRVHVDVECTNVIGTDGRYTYRLTTPNTGRVIEIEGTFQISDGCFIDTMTKCSQTNVQLPKVCRGQIIRADRREMVFAYDGGASIVHYRKLEP